MRRFVGLLFPLASVLVVTACQERGQPPPHPSPHAPPPPAWAQAQAGGCGMYLFTVDACEAALDQACCAHEVECANDPACRQMAECWNYCESRRPSEGCNCFNNCVTVSTPPQAAIKFGAVADCSKNARYPQHLECRTGC